MDLVRLIRFHFYLQHDFSGAFKPRHRELCAQRIPSNVPAPMSGGRLLGNAGTGVQQGDLTTAAPRCYQKHCRKLREKHDKVLKLLGCITPLYPHAL